MDIQYDKSEVIVRTRHFVSQFERSLVDWNSKVYRLGHFICCSGDVHVITLTDSFGFECINRNRMDQLIVNSLNEQLQYHFNQRMFVWEMIEQVSEVGLTILLHALEAVIELEIVLSLCWFGAGRRADPSDRVSLL